jgi:hypothetical protein
MGQVLCESLIRDPDVDLLCDIEISIEVKIKLSLFGEMEIYVTGNDEYSDDIKDNEKGDLGLQSEGSFLEPSTDKRSGPLDGKKEVFGEKQPLHLSPQLWGRGISTPALFRSMILTRMTPISNRI